MLHLQRFLTQQYILDMDLLPTRFLFEGVHVFTGFLSNFGLVFFIMGDFNIHVDVHGSDGPKDTTLSEKCNFLQLVLQLTNLHEHKLDLILGPCDHNVIFTVRIC